MDYQEAKAKFYYEMYKQNRRVRKVCAIIQNQDKFLVIVKNGKAHNVGGSVEENESTRSAIAREVFEETGGNVKEIKYLTKFYYCLNWSYKDITFPNRRVEYFYLCTLKDCNLKARGIEGEFQGDEVLEWHTLEELETLNMPQNELELIRKCAKSEKL